MRVTAATRGVRLYWKQGRWPRSVPRLRACPGANTKERQDCAAVPLRRTLASKAPAYCAANWIRRGQTRDRGKLDTRQQYNRPVKSIFGKPPCPDWNAILSR